MILEDTLTPVERSLVAMGEQAGVASHGENNAAERKPVAGVGFDGREDSGRFAGFANAVESIFDGGADFRVAVFA